ncbi:hypothetical protein AB4084_13755, partial [Lysobacter sp. 2RAB21]
RRLSGLIFLAVLSACALPAGHLSVHLPDSKRETSENCALAKERQNQLAIDHWGEVATKERGHVWFEDASLSMTNPLVECP